MESSTTTEKVLSPRGNGNAGSETRKKENAAAKLVNRIKSHSFGQAFASSPQSGRATPLSTTHTSFSSDQRKLSDGYLPSSEPISANLGAESQPERDADTSSHFSASSNEEDNLDQDPHKLRSDEANVLSTIWHDFSKFTTKMVNKASHQFSRAGSAHPESPVAVGQDDEKEDPKIQQRNLNHHHHHHGNDTKKSVSSGSSLTSYVASLLPNVFYPSTFSPLSSHTDIVLQGCRYNAASAPRFMSHWASLPWITYREGIPPIRPSTYTSDVGWGCMIRAGQMMLATAFLQARFGRDWKLGDLVDETETAAYISIMFQFLDSADSAFSIHRLALVGRQLAKNIGEWFGPSTIAQALCQLVYEYPQGGLHVYIASDAIVYSKSVESVLKGISPVTNAAPENEEPVPKPVLVLVPLRLGVESFNMAYLDGLKTCLESNECVGIAGGRPNSALFFVGYQDDQLLCLDPHITRTAVERRPDFDYSLEDFQSYICDTPRALPVSHVDPSLVIGFLIRDNTELTQFISRWARMATLTKTPLFSVADTAPSYYSTWDSIYGKPPPPSSPSLSPAVSLSDASSTPLSVSPTGVSVLPTASSNAGSLSNSGARDSFDKLPKPLQVTKNRLKSLSTQASATLAKTRESIRRPSKSKVQSPVVPEGATSASASDVAVAKVTGESFPDHSNEEP